MQQLNPIMHTDNEYEELIREYSPLLDSVKKLTDPATGKNVLAIRTKEQADYTVHLDSAGWTIIHSSQAEAVDKTYETCEALLMAHSTQFGRQWHSILEKRLLDLGGVHTDY